MIMRAPVSDLPLMFVEASILAGEVTILDRISLTLEAGAPDFLAMQSKIEQLLAE